MRQAWIWAALSIAATAMVALVTFVFPANPLRPVIVMGFLFFFPGMALLRNFRLESHPAVIVMFATGLSIALAAILAALVLYANAWSPSFILLALIWFTLICTFTNLLFTALGKGIASGLEASDETTPRAAVH